MSFEPKEWKNRLSENPTRRTLTPVDGGSPMVVDVTRNEGTIMQQGDPFNADNMNDLERRIAEGIGGGEDIIAHAEQEQSLNAYAVGQKLIFNGILYNVISPIAIGNSLVPGVNIEATTVSGLINILEDEFTANGNRLYMDYKNGKYGMNTDPERGADTFIPFKSGSQSGTFTAECWHNKEYGNPDGWMKNTMSMATDGIISITQIYEAYGDGSTQYSSSGNSISFTITNKTKNTSVSYSSTGAIPRTETVTGKTLEYSANDILEIYLYVSRSESWGIFGRVWYSITET